MTLTDFEREARRSGIGGSDLAAIMGLDDYRGPLLVYGSKVDGIDQKGSVAMQRGNYLESFAC